MIIRLGETTSTQDDAKRAASEGAAAWTTFVADSQTKGRGRQGRAWLSPPGSALLASVILRPRIEPHRLPQLALVVGVAMSDALASRIETRRVGIKWPNDVHVDDRKIAGILVEAQLRGAHVDAAIAGFGVNLRHAALPPDVEGRATSLEAAGAADFDRDRLVDDVLARLRERLSRFETNGLAAILPELRARDAAKGRHVRGESVTGIAEGIDDEGRLLVRTDTALVPVVAGEVSFPDHRSLGVAELERR